METFFSEVVSLQTVIAFWVIFYTTTRKLFFRLRFLDDATLMVHKQTK